MSKQPIIQADDLMEAATKSVGGRIYKTIAITNRRKEKNNNDVLLENTRS